MDDVKRPGGAVPSATSRPLVVANRAVLTNDPMVLASVSQGSVDTKLVPPAARDARIIEPLNVADSAVTSETNAPDTEQQPKGDEPVVDTSVLPPQPTVDTDTLDQSASKQTEPAQTVPAEVTPSGTADEQTSQPAVQPPTGTFSARSKTERDPEAELSAEEIAKAEAQAKRDLELEQLIASGTYHVPINAVQRRRSRLRALLFSCIAVVAVVVIADIMLDAGVVKAPGHIPHTHFFSTTS
jgi:hypothetical protein